LAACESAIPEDMESEASVIFQVLLIVIFGTGFVLSLVALVRGAASPFVGLLGALLSITATLAAVWPDATTRIARWLGIGLGKDLLLYCSIVLMLVGFFMTYTRMRRLRRELTLLVRQLAILSAEDADAAHPSGR